MLSSFHSAIQVLYAAIKQNNLDLAGSMLRVCLSAFRDAKKTAEAVIANSISFAGTPAMAEEVARILISASRKRLVTLGGMACIVLNEAYVEENYGGMRDALMGEVADGRWSPGSHPRLEPEENLRALILLVNAGAVDLADVDPDAMLLGPAAAAGWDEYVALFTPEFLAACDLVELEYMRGDITGYPELCAMIYATHAFRSKRGGPGARAAKRARTATPELPLKPKFT